MMSGNPLRGARVGAGRLGEQERGERAPRQQQVFHCANQHHTPVTFAVEAEVPELWECPTCGLPAGTDAAAPPPAQRNEPFKTHLAYVRERRSDAEGEALLADALAKVAAHRTPRDCRG